ncbi:predicted protein [Arabidopsis lyrata subsp. lyrata]|uniref:Predicted protein n=1 Tax=Arabidopsis lyrata subsp. lyrata TaxID=81972 RepID=D7LAG4_ARALL|nr:predicted protein [Arabidopsis lyrata subsp. lyrata]
MSFIIAIVELMDLICTKLNELYKRKSVFLQIQGMSFYMAAVIFLMVSCFGVSMETLDRKKNGLSFVKLIKLSSKGSSRQMINKVIGKHKRVPIKSPGNEDVLPIPPKIANRAPKYMVDRVCVETVKSSTGQESCTIAIPANIRHQPNIDASTQWRI